MSRERTSDEPSAARAAAIGAGLCFACAVIAGLWWSRRTSPAPREFHEPAPSETEAPNTGRAEIPGGVLVHVVDASDGSAIADVEVLLAGEVPVSEQFGRARSDAHGDARFEGIFAARVMAGARRSERYAAAVTLARGEPTSERRALLRLGPGGTITGRVIDDTGAPLGGVELSLPQNPPWADVGESSTCVTRTAADGSYRIERVLDLPRLLIQHGDDVFAAASAQVIVEANGLAGPVRNANSVQPCGAIIAPDLVLPRPPIIAGRVLDAQRRALAGALVSANPDRQRLIDANLHAVDPRAFDAGLADLPGMPRFALLPGETLSGADGSFELAGATLRASVLVGARDGRLEMFPIGAWRPGARIDRAEFVLAQRAVLRMRLFDLQDRPILGVARENATGEESSAQAARLRISPISGVLVNAWNTSKVDLLAQLEDGSEVRVQAAPAGDHSFTFALPLTLSSVERLSLCAPGYKTLVREVRGRLREEALIAEEHLEPLDALELDLDLGREFELPPGSDGQTVQIRACALPPDNGAADPAHPRAACCGFGMWAEVTLRERRRRVSIPMLTDQPVWLTLRTRRGRRGDEFVLGPFTASSEARTIEVPALPPANLSWEMPQPAGTLRDPLADQARLRASVCVFDADTHAALSGASVWALCDPLGRETLRARTWTSRETGCAALDDLASGSWTFVVSAQHHRAATLGPIELPPAGTAEVEIDLGEVQLTPVH